MPSIELKVFPRLGIHEVIIANYKILIVLSFAKGRVRKELISPWSIPLYHRFVDEFMNC